MNSDAGVVRGFLESDAVLRNDFRDLFGMAPAAVDDGELLALVGKALSAYQRTLLTPRTAFDEFRDALLAADDGGIAAYPEDARRGLKLFVGRGRCSLCHLGPAFSNGEFADIGIGHMTRNGGVDRGRLEGIRTVRASVYTPSGIYNDAPASRDAAMVTRLRYRHESFGEFKVPGLRGVAGTAPYMHNGSLATLEAVVRHYAEPDMSRFHADGVSVIRPLNLSDAEVADLVAFLRTLGDYRGR